MNEDKKIKAYDIICMSVAEHYRDELSECGCRIVPLRNTVTIVFEHSGEEHVFKEIRQAIPFIEGVIEGCRNRAWDGR